jgi:hypothetical protein
MKELSPEVLAAAVIVAGNWTPQMVAKDNHRMGDEPELTAYERHFQKCLQSVVAVLGDSLR